MRRTSVLVRGLIVAVLVAPAAVIVSTAAGPAAADPTIATHVALGSLPDNPVSYGTGLSIRGQVHYTDPGDGREYAAEGQVVLEQRNYTDALWTTIASTDMTGYFPSFDFDVVAQRICDYRVTFVGDETYAPSTETLTVTVSRRVTGKVVEPRDNVYFLKGKVSPAYAGRPISLMRQKCSTCSWRVYTTKNTTATSNYKFRLPLPRNGINYFKARVAADTMFVRSYSPTWHLYRIL